MDFQTLEKALQLCTPQAAATGNAQKLALLTQQLKKTKEETPTVLVCGEFKRGKSTFVNALIGNTVCPTDVDICTSVVSIISYGEKEKVIRHFGDFKNIKTEEIPFDQLERYTVGDADAIDNTLWVEIELPLEPLKKGLRVIDTPGVGGLDPRHAALTNYFLPEADVVVFMTDVNEPLTTTEIDFYSKRVLPAALLNMVVVNKADLREPDEVKEFMADTKAKLIKNTAAKEGDFRIVAVSSAAEAYPDADLGDSNFEALRTMIATLVDDYRRLTLDTMAQSLLEFVDLLAAPLNAQLEQIEQPNVDQLSALAKRKEEIEKRVMELTDSSSPFLQSVNGIITTERENFDTILNDVSVDLQGSFNQLIKDERSHDDNGGKWLGTQLNNTIADISSQITLKLNETFSHIAMMPQFEGSLNFQTKEYGGKVSVRDVDTTVPLNRRITPLMSGVGIITVGSMYIATGPIGIAAFCLLGAYTAWSNQKDSGNSYIENNLRQTYQPQLSGALQSLRSYVNSRFTEFQQKWVSAVKERAKMYGDSIKESMAAIQKVKQDINQAVSMRAVVQGKLKPLDAAKELLTAKK